MPLRFLRRNPAIFRSSGGVIVIVIGFVFYTILGRYALIEALTQLRQVRYG